MLTQVHRGESAPRVTGQYPQGLKTSSSTPTGQGAHLGRNNARYTSSSVNNQNRAVSIVVYILDLNIIKGDLFESYSFTDISSCFIFLQQ